MSKSEETKKEKGFDQFGKEIEDRKAETELISIEVTREELNEIFEQRHEKFSKVELTHQGQFLVALAYVHAAKALLEATSKEKAKELLGKVVYDFAYMEGRKAAETRGNPKDLRSYLEYQHEGLSRAAFIPPPQITEWTETKYVGGIDVCPYADSIRQIGELFPEYADKDVLEVAISRCDGLDAGRANGFNPDMKITRTHFKLDDMIGGPPSKGCYFEFEVEKESK